MEVVAGANRQTMAGFPLQTDLSPTLAPLPRADPAGVAHQQFDPNRPPHVGEGGLPDGPGIGVSGADAEVGESEGEGWSVYGDPDRILTYHAQGSFAGRVSDSEALLWVA